MDGVLACCVPVAPRIVRLSVMPVPATRQPRVQVFPRLAIMQVWHECILLSEVLAITDVRVQHVADTLGILRVLSATSTDLSVGGHPSRGNPSLGRIVGKQHWLSIMSVDLDNMIAC